MAEYEAALNEPTKARRRARLRELLRSHEATMTVLNDATATWMATTVPAMHAAGAVASADMLGTRFQWTMPHRAAVEDYATRTWNDIAARLRSIDRDTRNAIRGEVRTATRTALLDGKTATQAGREFAREAARNGMWSVEYGNGAMHTMRDYGDMVIRTTTATSYNRGSVTQSIEDGIEYVQYADGAGCGVYAHNDDEEADGLIVPITDVVYLAHPNCIMPGQRVIPYGGLTEMRRAWFSGPRIEILVEVGSGRHKLAVGPNHPVLTRSGWKPGDQIGEGDYLVHDERANDAWQGGLESDLDQMPLVEDLYATVRAGGSHTSVPATGDDLHGDGVFCQGEVDVVWPAWGLLVVGDPTSVEHGSEVDLMRADEGVDASEGLGLGDPLGVRAGGAPNGVVSGGDRLLSLLWGGLRPPQLRGFAGGSSEPVATGDRANGCPSPAYSGADLFAGHAEGVELADAVDPAGLTVHGAESGDESAAALLGPDLAAALTGHIDLVGLGGGAALDRAELPNGPVGAGEGGVAQGAFEGGGHRFTFSQVVDVKVSHYEGWVYDMSTGEGVFACSQLITRNCRRAILPWTGLRGGPGSDGYDLGEPLGEDAPVLSMREPRAQRAGRTPRRDRGV